MDRERALSLIKEKVKNKNLIKHMLAVEQVMRALARKFGEDEEIWALAGLIHDLDVEETARTPERHGKITAEILEKEGVSQDIIYAVLAHSGQVPCRNLMDKALYAADPLTGLIVACALVAREKKLENVDVDFIKRRWKEKRFAMGASREQIQSCEQMGISRNEFIQIGLLAMKEIAEELGL